MPLRSSNTSRRQLATGLRPLAPVFRISLSFLLLAFFCLGTLALPGCGGCWSDNSTTAANKKKEDEKKKEEEKKKKKKKAEKPKPDFEELRARTLPSNDPTPTQQMPEIRGKPGHWIVLSVTAKANNFDFPGELVAYAEEPATNFPLVVEDTNSRLSISRPASLPKGQSRPLPTLVYLPRKETGRIYSLSTELRGSRGGSRQKYFSIKTDSMKDYQYLMVVLASNPSSYTHLDKAHSIRMPKAADYSGNDTIQHYFVIRPNVEKSAPLPTYPLAWTNTAFVFWDDINPDVLTQEQQQALIDWIHWGGQLIISGPGSLDKLKGKPLAAYLPAESTEAAKLDQAAFDELNRVFSLQRDPIRAQPGSKQPKDDHLRKINITAERPMVGASLKLHADAREVEGTGGLVVERRIGGGRIVVTRFPLTDVRIRQWKNFDGFLNTVLLRRPARAFGSEAELGHLTVQWLTPELSHMLLEPRVGSTLRYFSRDIGDLPKDEGPSKTNSTAAATADLNVVAGSGSAAPGAVNSGAPVYGAPPMMRTQFGGMGYAPEETPRPQTWQMQPEIDDWHFLGYQSLADSGVAAWNDGGAASLAARQALTEAAGIEIPKADFVIKVLAVYLIVLVPLNWLVFWLMGRVEWAWMAAPLIAIVGAGTVIRMAQLDIGFARSRTEIAILEMQGNYDRAHLTRYTALYTSLSSTYTVGFDEQSALALPFSSGKQPTSPVEIRTYTNVQFQRDKQASLTGVKVSSNSTGMVHSEQMYPLKGKLTLVGDEQQGFTLKNTSDLTIHDIGVFRRTTAGALQTAFVAKIESQTTVPLVFRPLEGKAIWLPEWNAAPTFGGVTGPVPDDQRGRVRLTGLARLATQQLRLVPGDVRLVGWTDELLGGMQISPAAPQNTTYTLVLAHLVRGALPPVVPDKNVAEDYFEPALFETDPNDPNAPMLEPADPTLADPTTLQLTP